MELDVELKAHKQIKDRGQEGEMVMWTLKLNMMDVIMMTYLLGCTWRKGAAPDLLLNCDLPV